LPLPVAADADADANANSTPRLLKYLAGEYDTTAAATVAAGGAAGSADGGAGLGGGTAWPSRLCCCFASWSSTTDMSLCRSLDSEVWRAATSGSNSSSSS
jgi:hypothetical protein